MREESTVRQIGHLLGEGYTLERLRIVFGYSESTLPNALIPILRQDG